MQFQGRIYKVFPVQSGTSASGKEWSRMDFIFEYFENPTDRYADRVLLNVMNERIKEYDIQEGDTVVIGFAHTTREYQGRYFNDIRMYHFEKVKQILSPAKQVYAEAQPQQAQAPTAPAPAQPTQTVAPQQGQIFPPEQQAQGGDELPF